MYNEIMPKHTQSLHFKDLHKKWTSRHRHLQKNLWERHKDSLQDFYDSSKNLAISSLASILLLAHPASASILAQGLEPVQQTPNETPAEKRAKLIETLKQFLPGEKDPLSEEQENNIAQILTDYFGIQVIPQLTGHRLNRSYGIIGAEQHLTRYPGDSMASHFDTPEERIYWSSGMAPGRGAWGYFAPSKEEMTEQDKLREKYYIAVQTFLSPGWQGNVKEHYDFFRYRKMLVVNPENGKAIVADIGDAGPAQWTGKHLGGSPEVMSYLERQDGSLKGPVLYFFIVDPEDKVTLGPVKPL